MSERNKTRAIIKEALDNGFTVSVYDGEEWAVKKSTNAVEILDAAMSTGQATLRFRYDGETFGSVFLVYGNGEEDLVCDVYDVLDPETDEPLYHSVYW